MAYVKIDNPEIIDMASIQKIIDVINDHSDYLNVLVNRFGADYIPDWLADDLQSDFDLATSNIVFGKVKLDPSETDHVGDSNGNTYYRTTFPFETGVTFSQIPRVIVSHDNTDGTIGGQLDIVVSTHNVTTTGFTVRAYKPDGSAATAPIIVNFIAIGPR
jgi:hypothetical protein